MYFKVYKKRFGRVPTNSNTGWVGRKRQGSYDIYGIKRNEEGWHVEFISIGGQCNRRGEPYLFRNLAQDGINYPYSLGDYMEFLWNQSKNKNEKWIQQKLNVISKWICDVERTSPESKFWRSLK